MGFYGMYLIAIFCDRTMENGPVEIVDLRLKNGDFPYLCKRLPEGNRKMGVAMDH